MNSRDYKEKKEFLVRLEYIFGLLLSMAIWGIMTWGYYIQYGKVLQLLITVVVYAVFGVAYALFRNLIGKFNSQLMFLSVQPVALSVAIIFSSVKTIDFDGNMVYWVFCALPFAIYFIICGCISFINGDTVMGQWFNREKFIILVIAVAIAMRLPFIEMMQRWDSGEYYWRFSQAVQQFTFTDFEEYRGLFCICNHPTMMFSLIYLPGELIFPKRIIGVSLTSFCITAVTLWCIYKVILRIVKGTSEKNAAIYTFIISLAPLFYSTVTYFNPDYALGCFFMMALYGFIYNKPLIAGAASLMCFQTKETGIVIVFGLVVGTFIRHISSGKGTSAIKKIATDGCLYTTLAFTILQLWYMKTIGGVSQWTQYGEENTGIKWDSNGTNCLGYNITHIVTKLKQQFVLNFNWLIVVIILVCAIVLIVYGIRDKKKKEKNEYIHCIIASLVAFVAFSCLYITAPMARYNVVGDILLYLIAIYVVERVRKVVKVRKEIVALRAGQAAVGVLLVVQCFITIDPFTLLNFINLDTDSVTMCYTGDKNKPVGDIFYGDYLIYNTQYTYIDRAYDYILKETGYEADWNIIIPTSNGNFINGNMYRLNWDDKRKRRVFYTNGNTGEMSDYILTEDLYQFARQSSDKVLLIVNPYYKGIDNEAAVNEALEYYNLVDQGRYSSIQGCIYYYVLER